MDIFTGDDQPLYLGGCPAESHIPGTSEPSDLVWEIYGGEDCIVFSMGFTSNAFGGHTTLKTSHISRLFSVNLPRSQSRPQKPSCSSSFLSICLIVYHQQIHKISMQFPNCDSKNVYMTNLVAYHHFPSSHDDCNELKNTQICSVECTKKYHVGSCWFYLASYPIHFISVALDSPEFLGSQPPAKLTCDFRARDCFVDGDLLKFKENT